MSAAGTAGARRRARPTGLLGARIAMFINSLQRGGAETQFLRLARSLRSAGCDVRIFVLLPDNDFADQLGGIPVELLATAPGTRTVARAVRAVRAWRPDIVLSFLYQATVIGRVAAAAGRVPVVVSSMRNERLESRLRDMIYRATSHLDTVIVANSRSAKAALEAAGTIPRGVAKVIANGVDLDRFTSPAPTDLRAELELAPNTIVFLGVGRLTAQKDWPTLVAGVAAYRGPAAHWAIAGAGPGRAELQAQIVDAGLSRQITLLGLRDDVPSLLGGCDAVVLSSRYEGMPNVVLEAMAAGRPVVATRVGGCPELLDPTAAGLLVDPGDPDQLAAAMAELAGRSFEQRAAMGSAGAAHVRANFSLEAAARQWQDLLAELLRHSGRTPSGFCA